MSDDEVVHPVTRGSKRNAIWTIAQGPDLSDDDPSAWSPRVSEMDDEEPDHGHGCPTSCLVRGPLIFVLRYDDRNDDMACRHSNSTDSEDGFATELVDVQDCWDGGEEHGNSNDAGGEQRDGVGGQAKGSEDCGGIVQNGVDASPLLEEHSDGGNADTSEHRFGAEQGADGHELQLEDIPSGEIAEAGPVLCHGALLKERLGFDFQELEFDQLMVLGKAAEVCQHLSSFCFAIVMDEPTRRERHEEDSSEEDNGREELETDG